MLLRLLDLVLSLLGLVFGFPIMITLFVIGLFDTGSPLFFQQRVGKNMMPFVLVKFRTMKKDTASIASHLANAESITKFGHFFASYKAR